MNAAAGIVEIHHRIAEAGLAVDYSLTPAKPDKQFKRARKSTPPPP